jgi:protein SCO1/2
VLKKYADKLGISGNSWWLLQGNKEETYELGQKDYLVAVKKMMVHPAVMFTRDGLFWLINKNVYVVIMTAPTKNRLTN